MKTFKQYLLESQKQYKVTIKLCFKPTDEDCNKIEFALNQFQLVSCSNARSVPIRTADRHFPGLISPEIYMIDAVLEYPASTDQVRAAITNETRIPPSQFVVVNTSWDASMNAEDAAIQKNLDKNLLQDPLDDQHIDVQDVYGDKYNEKLVHNVKRGKINAPNAKENAKTTNDLPQGTKSPIGTKANKLPKINSFAR